MTRDKTIEEKAKSSLLDRPAPAGSVVYILAVSVDENGKPSRAFWNDTELVLSEKGA